MFVKHVITANKRFTQSEANKAADWFKMSNMIVNPENTSVLKTHWTKSKIMKKGL